MTPTTPAGWYSIEPCWSIVTGVERTLRGRMTRSAWRAAQSRWSTTSTSSITASSDGLPFSRWMRSIRSSPPRTMAPLTASRRSRRSAYERPRHHRATSRARRTAASTSSCPCTGNVPTRSPVAGLIESNVRAPVVAASIVAAMAQSLRLRHDA